MNKICTTKMFAVFGLFLAICLMTISSNAAVKRVVASDERGREAGANYGYVELSGNEDSVTGRITNVGRDNTTKGNIALEWKDIERPNNYVAKMQYKWIINNKAETTYYRSLTI